MLDGFVITGGNANGPNPDNFGGGILNLSNSTPLIRNCLFTSNSAANFGGAMHTVSPGSNSSLILTNSSFESNSATFGGAMIGHGSSVLTNVSFSRNRATNDGGAIYYDGSTRSTLTNVSFTQNTAGFGGDIRSFGEGVSLTLTNGVVFTGGIASGFAITGGSSLLVRYSLLDSSIPGSAYTSGPGNLTTATSPFSSSGSTQLSPTSLAINAGDPATTSATVDTIDLAGNPRFVNTLIDMGAYEFQQILEVISLKTGSWNDVTLWSVGRLPLARERVRLRHSVTIPTNHTALGSTLLYDAGGRLVYQASGKLRLGQ